MSKRASSQTLKPGALKAGQRPVEIQNPGPDPEMGEFQDEFEDEFESEGEVIENPLDSEDEDEIMVAGVDGRPDEELEMEMKDAQKERPAFIPNRHKLAPGEVLTPDPSAYHMLHTFETTWPCLSCDIVPDSLGDDRQTYPATVYAVAGTQATRASEKKNQLLVLKMSKLSRMPEHIDSDDESDEDEEENEPSLESVVIPQTTCTNRIRSFQTPATANGSTTIYTGSMLETGEVHIHNITSHLASLDDPTVTISSAANKPVGIVKAHGNTEGYAIDWASSSLHPAGLLLTGDTKGRVFATAGTESGTFVTDGKPFTGHIGTVEEIQWSPSEKTVFTTGGDDGMVRVWDTRMADRKPVISVRASETDVNVLSWSRTTAHLLASGHDDGSFSVWDLRSWKPTGNSGSLGSSTGAPRPVASFNFHQEQVTSLEWHPTDDSVILAGAADNTFSIWDLSVEFDEEENKASAGEHEVPPQLLFLHVMEGCKEAHWHKQIPGLVLATGLSGLNVYKTISV